MVQHLRTPGIVGAELFHADGRTDMTTVIVAFRKFANAPKSISVIQNVLGKHKEKERQEERTFFFPCLSDLPYPSQFYNKTPHHIFSHNTRYRTHNTF